MKVVVLLNQVRTPLVDLRVSLWRPRLSHSESASWLFGIFDVAADVTYTITVSLQPFLVDIVSSLIFLLYLVNHSRSL